MAKAYIGATPFSKILISMASAKKECIENKNQLSKIYENILGKLQEYSKEIEKSDLFKKIKNRLYKRLEDAKLLGDDEEIKAVEKELEELLVIQNTIKDLENIATNSKGKPKKVTQKALNDVLSNRMREIYKNNHLCPYCHGLNAKCGFLDGLSPEQVEKLYERPIKKGYKNKDKEGIEFLENQKSQLLGKKVEIKVKNANGVYEDCEFDLGENMSIQEHHTNSFNPYAQNSTVSIAGSRHGFDINGTNNIVALESVNTNQGPKGGRGVKVIKNGKVEYVPWTDLDEESREKIFEEYIKTINENLKKAEEIPKSFKGIPFLPVHLGPHESKIINLGNIIEQIAGEDVRYSYEECVSLENAKLEENMFNMINAGNYLCSNMTEAQKWYEDQMDNVINTIKEKFLKDINETSSKIIDKMQAEMLTKAVENML